MTKIMKRSLALLAALLICISFLPILAINAGAATSTDTVVYNKSGNYVYNWGEREVDATFLSPMAIEFYEDLAVTYKQLSSYNGGTSQSNAPSS
ncbi:MAG: hypothetical protein IJC80_03355 [Clostridia bacterium]|nr:hypothetical protein [Clostridia bacterium]